MVGYSVDPLSHTLGRIESALDLITKTLNEDRIASASYRTDIRRDLTNVRDMVHDLRNKVENTANDLADMKPDVDDYRLMKAKGLGAWSTAKIIWTILIGLGAAGIGAIISAFWPHR